MESCFRLNGIIIEVMVTLLSRYISVFFLLSTGEYQEIYNRLFTDLWNGEILQERRLRLDDLSHFYTQLVFVKVIDHRSLQRASFHRTVTIHLEKSFKTH